MNKIVKMLLAMMLGITTSYAGKGRPHTVPSLQEQTLPLSPPAIPYQPSPSTPSAPSDPKEPDSTNAKPGEVKPEEDKKATQDDRKKKIQQGLLAGGAVVAGAVLAKMVYDSKRPTTAEEVIVEAEKLAKEVNDKDLVVELEFSNYNNNQVLRSMINYEHNSRNEGVGGTPDILIRHGETGYFYFNKNSPNSWFQENLNKKGLKWWFYRRLGALDSKIKRLPAEEKEKYSKYAEFYANYSFVAPVKNFKSLKEKFGDKNSTWAEDAFKTARENLSKIPSTYPKYAEIKEKFDTAELKFKHSKPLDWEEIRTLSGTLFVETGLGRYLGFHALKDHLAQHHHLLVKAGYDPHDLPPPKEPHLIK